LKSGRRVDKPLEEVSNWESGRQSWEKGHHLAFGQIGKDASFGRQRGRYLPGQLSQRREPDWRKEKHNTGGKRKKRGVESGGGGFLS